MRAWVSAALFATGLVAFAGIAQAAPIAYDGIQYLPGPLAGNGPAFGFAAPWLADPAVTVVPVGLSSLLDLPATGRAVAGDFNFQAPLVVGLVASPGREFWASFLLQHVGPNDETYMGLSPAGAVFGDPPSVGIGVRLGQYGIFVGGAFTPAPKPFTPAGSTDFLVARFVSSGAVWTVELFVNPSSFAVPDLVMNVAPLTYGTMVNLNEVEFESDEFRLGDMASDVSALGVVPTKGSTWGRLKQLYH